MIGKGQDERSGCERRRWEDVYLRRRLLYDILLFNSFQRNTIKWSSIDSNDRLGLLHSAHSNLYTWLAVAVHHRQIHKYSISQYDECCCCCCLHYLCENKSRNAATAFLVDVVTRHHRRRCCYSSFLIGNVSTRRFATPRRACAYLPPRHRPIKGAIHLHGRQRQLPGSSYTKRCSPVTIEVVVFLSKRLRRRWMSS